jgi:hypothetical protein
MKRDLVREIVDLEWAMFSSIDAVGGRASCQEDPRTFEFMRASQAETWTEEVRESYLADLLEAKATGRNLLKEKYARMMETAFPEEYAFFADRLPPVDAETLARIEDVVAINVKWKTETAAKYPRLHVRGRPTHTFEDTRTLTSFETYLRGELQTYGVETNKLYHKMTRDAYEAGENLEEACLLNSVLKYGYPSLEEAEKQAQPYY